MNFFRKKIIVNYHDSILEKEDIEQCFNKIPKNLPKYFSSIPKNMFSLKSKKFIPYLRTIKTCPGFINLYKRSLLVTSPFDIYVGLEGTKIIDMKAGRTNFEIAEEHPGDQFLNYTPNKVYKCILKISLPFEFDSNVSLFMSETFYHFNDFNVLPGILPSSYNSGINFFIPVKKNQNDLYIKKGDPLFLLTPLCETEVKLKFKKINKNLSPSSIKDNLTFSSLKKYILKNVF